MEDQRSKGSVEVLKNIKAVVTYLNDAGWKASKSTVYRHHDEGKIRSEADGCFKTKAVEKYAKDWLKTKNGTGKISKKISPLQNAKQAEETRRISAQADIAEMKAKILRGEYVERAAFERALAQRAAIFKSDIENFIRSHAGEMVHLVDGDSLKIPDLIDFWLKKAEGWLGRYSEDRERDLPGQIDFNRFEAMEN